jgi:hypothetical protein
MPEVALSPGTFQEKRKKLRRQIKGMVQNLEKECYRIIFDVFPGTMKYRIAKKWRSQTVGNGIQILRICMPFPTVCDLHFFHPLSILKF